MVIEDGDETFKLAESGAIISWIIEHYGNGRLQPPASDKQARLEYDFWYAASSPVRVRSEGKAGCIMPKAASRVPSSRACTGPASQLAAPRILSSKKFSCASLITVRSIAESHDLPQGPNLDKHFHFIEDNLSKHAFFVGNELTRRLCNVLPSA